MRAVVRTPVIGLIGILRLVNGLFERCSGVYSAVTAVAMLHDAVMRFNAWRRDVVR